MAESRKVALITGASSGIGYATALAFARAGWHVVAAARRADRLDALAAEIAALSGEHGGCLPIVADVQSMAQMQQVVEAALERFGRLDVLVANAGLGQRGALADAEWQHLETVLRTNIDGVYHSIRAAVPAMRKTGGGQLILISSIVFNLVAPYTATYAASKAFVSSLARSLRLELASENIRVADILVGRTESEFGEKRLGASGYSANAARLPVMKAEYVAARILQAAERGTDRRLTLRWLDRLIVWANALIPSVIGRLAIKQYR